MHDNSTQDFIQEPNPNAKWDYACTTDFRGTTFFKHLRDFLQPDTDKALWDTIDSILEIIPEAPLSSEVLIAGQISLEIAEQIPWDHPSQMRLAQVMQALATSPKISEGAGTVSTLFYEGSYISEQLTDVQNRWGERFATSLAERYEIGLFLHPI